MKHKLMWLDVLFDITYCRLASASVGGNFLWQSLRERREMILYLWKVEKDF